MAAAARSREPVLPCAYDVFDVSVQELSLGPATTGFRAPRPPSTTAVGCWLHDGNSDAWVAVTGPTSDAARHDAAAVPQAMLRHLVTERGTPWRAAAHARRRSGALIRPG